MEKKYLVVVYHNLRSLNNYDEFIDRRKAEDWYKYILNKIKQQKDEDKNKPNYILDVRLYKLVEVWSSK